MLKGILLEIVKNNYPMLLVFGIILIITKAFYLKDNSKHFSFYKEVLSLIFLVYLIMLYDILIKIDPSVGTNFTPIAVTLQNVLDKTSYLKYVVLNIIAFIPVGYYISSYIKLKKLGTITLISLISGIAIEFVKYKTVGTFNIDNILEWIIGSILGFLLYIGFAAIKKKLPDLFQNDLIYNVLCISFIILLVLYFLGIISFGWVL